jgi:predicted transcriptional regulator
VRAWLYRVAHNRCIDHLRRAGPAAVEVIDGAAPDLRDPLADAERREELRRLLEDVRRLPVHQRSALVMRELEGLSYTELSDALGVSVAAVKSLLVRARMGLAEAVEARESSCADIRRDVALAVDNGGRTPSRARRHMRDCEGCRAYRGELHAVRRRFAALTPSLGPLGLLAKLTGGSAVALGGSAATGGGAASVGGGAIAGGVVSVSAGKVAAIVCAAAVVTAEGAIEVKRQLASSAGAPAPERVAPAVGPATLRAARPTVATDPKPVEATPAVPVAGEGLEPTLLDLPAAVTEQSAIVGGAVAPDELADDVLAATGPTEAVVTDGAPATATKPADGEKTSSSGEPAATEASGSSSSGDGQTEPSGSGTSGSPSGSDGGSGGSG